MHGAWCMVYAALFWFHLIWFDLMFPFDLILIWFELSWCLMCDVSCWLMYIFYWGSSLTKFTTTLSNGQQAAVTGMIDQTQTKTIKLKSTHAHAPTHRQKTLKHCSTHIIQIHTFVYNKQTCPAYPSSTTQNSDVGATEIANSCLSDCLTVLMLF